MEPRGLCRTALLFVRSQDCCGSGAYITCPCQGGTFVALAIDSLAVFFMFRNIPIDESSCRTRTTIVALLKLKKIITFQRCPPTEENTLSRIASTASAMLPQRHEFVF